MKEATSSVTHGRFCKNAQPDNDDDSIKNIKYVEDVFKQAVGQYLRDHLKDEHGREHDVAVLQDRGEILRL